MKRTWTIRCPLHDDKHPSLYVSYDDTTNTVFWRCFAGCQSTDRLKEHVMDFLASKGVRVSTPKPSSDQLEILDSFDKLHLEDFRSRGLSVKDAVRYAIKPARYGDLVGLAIPIHDSKGRMLGHQFCNLTPPRSPKYLSVSRLSHPSYVGSQCPSTVVVAEGHYKAICVHKHLMRIADVPDLLVVGVTCKTSFREAESLAFDTRNLTRCVVAMDRDVSEPERDKMVAAVRHAISKSVPILFPNYEMFPGDCKGFDDCLATLDGHHDFGSLVVSEHSSWVVRADKVDVEPVRWFIADYVPYQCITVVEGKPGVGKSYLTLAMASAATLGQARITSNLGFVPVNGEESRKCLIINCEDPPSIIASRLQQIGAPLDKCLIASRHMRFPSDIDVLDSIISAENIVALIIDTLTNHFDQGFSGNDESSVRLVLSALSVLCQKHNMFALVVRHLRKSSSDDDGVEAGIGSIGVAGIARSVIRVTQLDYGSRATLIKSNYARKDIAFEYNVGTLKVEAFIPEAQPDSVDTGDATIDGDEPADADLSTSEVEI